MSVKDNLIIGGIIIGFLIVVGVIFYLAYLLGHWLFSLAGIALTWFIIGPMIEFIVGLVIIGAIAIALLFLVVELL
ncbi:MAG: hypothetical protein QXJ68_06035 [Methanocellales archaeon]